MLRWMLALCWALGVLFVPASASWAATVPLPSSGSPVLSATPLALDDPVPDPVLTSDPEPESDVEADPEPYAEPVPDAEPVAEPEPEPVADPEPVTVCGTAEEPCVVTLGRYEWQLLVVMAGLVVLPLYGVFAASWGRR